MVRTVRRPSGPTRRQAVAGATAAALCLLAGGRVSKAAAAEPARVPIELAEEAFSLDAAIRIGSTSPDARFVEFFDYNCPYCRVSAQHAETLVSDDPDLDYVLVNYAVLGVPSIGATRVALAFAALYGPARYRVLHRELFALKGTIDGTRALSVATRLGADESRLVAAANGEEVTRRMTDAARLGDRLGLVATPSFLIGSFAYVGALDLAQKRRLIAAERA